MKKIQSYAIVILTLFFGFTMLKAQHIDIGFFANIGQGKLSSKTVETNPGISGNIGVAFSTPIGKKLDIGIGLNLLKINWEENKFDNPLRTAQDIINVMSGLPSVSSLTTDLKHNSTYIGIPMFLKYNFKRFAINAGLQTFIFSYGSYEGTSVFDETGTGTGVVTMSEINEEIDPRVIELETGPVLGVEYYILPSLSIRVDFYAGLIKLNNEIVHTRQKIRLATVGLNYYLTKTTREIEQ